MAFQRKTDPDPRGWTEQASPFLRGDGQDGAAGAGVPLGKGTTITAGFDCITAPAL